MVLVVVSLPMPQAAVMFTPGVNRSTQVPKLEKLARWSLMSEAPSVMAFGVDAGEAVQALALLLPAAMA